MSGNKIKLDDPQKAKEILEQNGFVYLPMGHSIEGFNPYEGKGHFLASDKPKDRAVAFLNGNTLELVNEKKEGWPEYHAKIRELLA